MKNFIKLLLIITILNFSLILPGFTSELPKPVEDFIKTKFPKAIIRFDTLITLPNGTRYLPVFPLNMLNADNPSKIVTTIPANTDFSKYPDLILFANNLALLKIIEMPDKTITLSSSPQIPLEVKLGILPQDLVVPENLMIPPELRVIAGDLKIPVKDINNSGKSTQSISKALLIPELKDLVNNTFYAANSQSNQIYIIFPQTGRPVKIIELPSIPSDVAITRDSRYILVSCLASGTVSVIDTVNNSLLKEFNVGKLPVSILVSPNSDTCYVANMSSSSISIIDLKTMAILKEIPTIGTPANPALAEDEQSLFYSDSTTGNIYKTSLITQENSPKLLTQISNISKMLQIDKNLFILSRSDNTLTIYDLSANKIVKTIEVGSKPVDMKTSKDKNKLYILSAGNNTLNILNLNDFTITNTITLRNNGFPKNITILNSVNKALISNADSYEVAIIDLNQEKISKYLPVSVIINSLAVSQTK